VSRTIFIWTRTTCHNLVFFPPPFHLISSWWLTAASSGSTADTTCLFARAGSLRRG
jgi:hypothetical protein